MTVAADQPVRERALDPAQSFIVQAPAGSGKTELLTRRILKLLATVDEPEQILAITFTRKAASEMRLRVIEALGEARQSAGCNNAHEAERRRLAEDVLARDSERGWDLLRNPQRLHLSTIDGLCTRLAHQLPTVSLLGAPAGIAENATELHRQAARALLDDADVMLDRLLLHVGNRLAEAESLFASLLARRDQWLRYTLHRFESNHLRSLLQQMLDRLVTSRLDRARTLCPVELGVELATLAEHAGRVKARLADPHLPGNSVSVESPLHELPGVEPADVSAWQHLAELLLTKGDSPRSRFDKRCGFPSSAADAAKLELTVEELRRIKVRITAAAEEFGRRPSLIRALADLRGLPIDGYSDHDWALLEQLIAALPALQRHLLDTFSRCGLVDFVEIGLRARHALGSADAPTDLALALDLSIRHILVDEFQDTSQSQFELFELLVAGWEPDDGRTFFAVGDPMQSIYRFRDADVSLFARARDAGIGDVRLEALKLTVNFRAAPALVTWINDTFGSVFPSVADNSIGAVPYSESIAHLTAAGMVSVHPLIDCGVSEEAERIADLVAESIAGDPLHRTAILLRSRGAAWPIVSALRARAINYIGVDMDRLTERSPVRDILSLALALSYPHDRLHWLAVLRAPWCGLCLNDLHTLMHGAADETVFELASDSARQARLSEDGRRRLSRVLAVLAPAVRQVPRSTLMPWVESAWLALGGPACTPAADDLAAAERALGRLEQLEQAGELIQPSRFRAAIEELYAVSAHAGSAQVQIMTLHKAKGLEFDTVILPALERPPRGDAPSLLNWFEWSIDGEPQLLIAPVAERSDPSNRLNRLVRDARERMDAEERLRLLYVACTRARQHLHLLGRVQCNASGELMAPKSRSLLQPLWQRFRPEFEAVKPAGATVNTSDRPDSELRKGGEGATGSSAAPPAIERLPMDWKLPALDVYQPAAPPPSVPRSRIPEFRWAGPFARDVGTVVHRQLQRFARTAIEQNSVSVPTLRRTVTNHLVQLGMPESVRESAVNQVLRAIDTTLADARGRWVLDYRHREARSEWALSGWCEGQVRRVVVDRTFIDRDGVRWVIDFKTGDHRGGNLDRFLESEVERYREQLQSYADIIALMEQRTIMAGLYFPLFAGWRAFRPQQPRRER